MSGWKQRFGLWTGVAVGALLPAMPVAAQTSPGSPEPEPDRFALAGEFEEIAFSADEIVYDPEAQRVSAQGQVRLASDGYWLAADRIDWDRASGEIEAHGNVVLLAPTGDRLIGERIRLDEALRRGAIDNFLLALDTGGRIAGATGRTEGGEVVVDDAVYSPCPVTGPQGCDSDVPWRITAARVVRNAETGRLEFRGAKLHIFGLDLPLLPLFSVGDPGPLGGVTGALVPDISISGINGLELSLPYYWRFDRHQDLTVTPHLYTGNLPGLSARWRQLVDTGAYQVGGFVTYGEIDNPDRDAEDATLGENFRGYFEGNGRFQFDPHWRATGSLRWATDKTVTRRFDLTRDDRLRNVVELERLDEDSYISIAGWAFQGLRVDDVQSRLPIALPAIDARWRLDDPVAGGRLELRGNSLAIQRREGQDTQRAFALARWDRRFLTALGQELTLTGYARGDVYHTDESGETLIPFYRGEDGWHARGIGALAADMRWPLIGEAFGGTQRLVPRVQLVLTPPTANLAIPNEDARAIDLEDSNLFALNRFPGYDRWEDGSRVTYGLEYLLDRPNFSIRSNLGQSYRLTDEPDIFPDGTGLTDQWSDFVGRTRLRFGRLVDLTARYRLDKDNLAPRRLETDLTVGSIETYATIGYLRLDRDIDPLIEDLRDKEELRLAGRLHFADHYSLFGSTVLDLTDAGEDPLSLSDGFEPARHRLGLAYEDDYIELGLSWKRDYERIGAFRKGSTFSIIFNLKGLGR
ncbi:LPS-assembly protein LptD [Sphingomicrobium astaxanthinifaciens]|uniref:LPS-assembly protein LptD n=1 Tax=Sphingomicrobium astaxanthinifaciens TaxID=1227949 RepID=UPI001FCC479A|nr:LPS assembly protein LptD [Sphingomicrobium astaxanthinifaciens]MCJ7422216.1 LPS assembly protein LptD [Sphingomicrobium astaxanthinifaciens]